MKDRHVVWVRFDIRAGSEDEAEAIVGDALTDLQYEWEEISDAIIYDRYDMGEALYYL